MATSIQSLPYQQQPQANDRVGSSRGTQSRIRQDVQALSTALQSGDLQTAQKSYGDLQKLLQSSGSISQAASTPSPASTSAPASPLDAVRSDFQALGQALQSGDLTEAKKDYAQLATDSQTLASAQGTSGAVTGHHHHGHRPPPPVSTEAEDPSSSSTSRSDPTTTASSSSSQFVSAYKFSYQSTSVGVSGANPAGTFQINAYQDSYSSVSSTNTASGQNIQATFSQTASESLSYTPPGSAVPQVVPPATPAKASSTSTAAAPPSVSAASYQSVFFQESYQSTSNSSTAANTPDRSTGAQSKASSSPVSASSPTDQIFKQLNDFFSNLKGANQNVTGASTSYQAISFEESFQSTSTSQANSGQSSNAYQFSFKASFESVSYLG